jgi:D-alanyl-D-alanine carboxypeptidase
MALVVAPAPASAAAERKHAALIVDANTGRVLYESAADEPRYPASLAKLMTLYIVFELIEQRRLTYGTRIKISGNAAGAAPSRLDLEEGEDIALIDAIKALITKSANDVAVAVAEHIAGSEDRFAKLMTVKARALGMKGTTFTNASGLPDDEQVTTARDIATLALRLYDDFPQHYPLFATRAFTFRGVTYRNHNKLLVQYAGTEGLKTGYIRSSGFNIVVAVRRGQKHVVGVVFGGASAASRDAHMRTLLNMAWSKASVQRTRKPAPTAAVASMAQPTVLIAPPKLVRGMPLSAFEQQAAHATGPGSSAPASGSRDDTSRQVERAGGLQRTTRPRFEIQVGAYQTMAEAERQLAAVRESAGEILSAYKPVAQEVRIGERVLYRSRYSGFDAEQASAVCRELKRKQIDCFALKAD